MLTKIPIIVMLYYQISSDVTTQGHKQEITLKYGHFLTKKSLPIFLGWV